MLKKIYFIGILVITLTILFLYILQEKDNFKEMDKIRRLEHKLDVNKRELSLIRSYTTPCPVFNLTNPRQCYIESGRKCSWNDKAQRCDLK